MTNPNENCLEGKKCPKCGSYGPFQITATSVFEMHDDGTDNHGDVEFDGSAPSSCPSCSHTGRWRDFDDPPSTKKDLVTYTVIGLYKDDGGGNREGGRYATVVQAESPEKAEEEAQEICRNDNSKGSDNAVDETVLDLDIGQEQEDLLDIAAVIEGDGFKIVA